MTKETYNELNSETEKQLEYMDLVNKINREKASAKGRPLTSCVVTFGCQMNERDSEKLKGILTRCGYELTDDETADLVLYNTCTVRENANLRLYGRLGHLSGMKKENPDKIIGICGCMAQEPDVVKKLETSYPFTDIIFGTFNVYKLAEILYSHLTTGSRITDIWESNDTFTELLPTVRKYPFKSGVNIMYGCDNFCTYCIVPYVRGREKSRRPEDIIYEIEQLVKDGVTEVMLLGQNVNSYGKGLKAEKDSQGDKVTGDCTQKKNKDVIYNTEPSEELQDSPDKEVNEGEITFAGLLRKAEQIKGLERIRFMTSHPKDLSDELIEVMAASEKICDHIHLPLQSGSTEILKRMNRKYTKEDYLALVEKIRRAMPDISITTDIIVGFPGESESDFEETLDVVRRVKFDSAYTFIYSKRTGTPAAAYEEQTDEATVKNRFDRLLKEIKTASSEVTGRYTGRTMPCLAESVNDHDPALITGRMSSNMLVHFPGDKSLIGKIVDVKITECKGFYYFGEMLLV